MKLGRMQVQEKNAIDFKKKLEVPKRSLQITKTAFSDLIGVIQELANERIAPSLIAVDTSK